jgi:16S rRNA (guanine527-N7)-methyltransferase
MRRMKLERIADLLQPFLDRTLPQVLLEQISTYIDLLLKWNARVNLTAIRDPEEIVTRHFGESLFLGRHLFPQPMQEWRTPSAANEKSGDGPANKAEISSESPGARPSPPVTALDIGSGAGFPGLPLKIWNPALSLTLVESNHKKAAFLREVIRMLTSTNVNVLTARAETLSGIIPRQDIVTFRAVEHFERILPIATNLVTPSGRLALLIGQSQLSSIQALPIKWTQLSIPNSQSRMLSISVPV